MQKMTPRRTCNPKRRIAPDFPGKQWLLEHAKYGGNPEHKRNPGDFALSPPAIPRPDKTLCDIAGVFTREQALDLLRSGIRRGMVSVQERNGHPQNIWAVREDGIVFEAQLENPALAVYHGYPLPEADPFREDVLSRWGNS